MPFYLEDTNKLGGLNLRYLLLYLVSFLLSFSIPLPSEST